MWERFPIQRVGMKGSHYSSISESFAYKRYNEVQVCKWKYIEQKPTILALWKSVFHCVRCPLTSNDLFAWVEEEDEIIGTLVARKGIWKGTKTRECVYILCNYVHPAYRKQQIAEKMIESICYEACKRWTKNLAFFFELERVPSSLSTATVFQRFRYAYIPSLQKREWTDMQKDKLYTILKNEKGFHPSEYAGYVGYELDDEWCILDAHDDVVLCSAYSALCFMHGVYARIPSSIGNVSLFAENMYFDKEPVDVYLLG